MIKLIELSKIFKKPIRGEGVLGMLKTIFSRKYEEIHAVKNVNLEISHGEIVGYIGSNGAGKSTTIKMMCGILTPSSGKVLINGLEPYKKRRVIAKDIGVVFGQKTQLWWDIPLIESYKILKEIYQVTDEEYKERLEFLCETLGIKDFLNQPVRTLSLGQRMRADLAAAWLHNPKILFLDEPTIGLDVLVKEKIRNAIKVMNQKYKTTIILTTHDMKDIEDLCSRVVMIEKGQIFFDGSIKEIKHRFGDLRTITITTKDYVDIENLNDFEGKIKYEQEDANIVAKFSNDHIHVDKVISYLLSIFSVEDIKLTQIGIEDVVKELFKDEEAHK